MIFTYCATLGLIPTKLCLSLQSVFGKELKRIAKGISVDIKVCKKPALPVQVNISAFVSSFEPFTTTLTVNISAKCKILLLS